MNLIKAILIALFSLAVASCGNVDRETKDKIVKAYDGPLENLLDGKPTVITNPESYLDSIEILLDEKKITKSQLEVLETAVFTAEIPETDLPEKPNPFSKASPKFLADIPNEILRDFEKPFTDLLDGKVAVIDKPRTYNFAVDVMLRHHWITDDQARILEKAVFTAKIPTEALQE